MKENNFETIVLGAGCFWCVEAVFQRLKGVISVLSGYSNGNTSKPAYEEVCSGNTGYAEVLEVQFDPGIISLHEVLNIFWHSHDPTTLNRQGNDVGTQYRSAIFYTDKNQKEIAETSKKEAQASGEWKDPIVTEINPLKNFFPAENYHQNYFNDNPYQPYCTFVVKPKVEKFKKQFKDKLKS